VQFDKFACRFRGEAGLQRHQEGPKENANFHGTDSEAKTLAWIPPVGNEEFAGRLVLLLDQNAGRAGPSFASALGGRRIQDEAKLMDAGSISKNRSRRRPRNRVLGL
jgi:hypothetical protein